MPEAAIDALVLAGGVNRVPLYEGYVPGYKALAPVAGRAAIRYTLDALQAAGPVRRIWVIGDEAALAGEAGGDGPAPVRFVPPGESLMESVLHGLRSCRDSAGVLLTTADLPLLTPAAVSDFLAARAGITTPWEHNLFLSVVPEHCYTGEYRNFTKPFNPFRDVSICHGNLALAEPAVVENTEAVERIDALYRNRKNPVTSLFSMGAVLGLAYAVGVFLLHALSLAEFSDIVSRHFHMGVIPVLLEHPEVSIDIDDADDYRFVTEHFLRTGACAPG